MSIVTIEFTGPDLSSRKAAAAVRQDILSYVGQGNRVILDLSNVLSISESYADELLGLPAGLYGLDWVDQHIQIKVSQEYVLRTIAVAIKRRLMSAAGELASRTTVTQRFQSK